MGTVKKNLKLFYTGDKITAIGFDMPGGTLDPVLIVNPLCKVEATERNRILVKMVNAYNGKLLLAKAKKPEPQKVAKSEPEEQPLPKEQLLPNFSKPKEQILPNFGDDIIEENLSDLHLKVEPVKLLPPTKGICVDVGCIGNPGKAEFRGVDIETGKQVFHIHIPGISTNNIGEWLGAVEGLKFCAGQDKDYKVYSDSLTAISWIRQKRCKTNFVVTNEEQKKMIEEAEKWLRQFGGRVEKWATHIFGEIPADFNRKPGAKGPRI